MPSTSLSPIPARDFGYDEAAHLLARAGFGGTPAQVQALAEMGLHKAVDHLVDYQQINDPAAPEADFDSDIIRPLTREQRLTFIKARRAGDNDALQELRRKRLAAQAEDRRQMAAIGRWWFARMVSTARPMQEKLVLLWHNHFATSYRTVRDSYLMVQQNQFFRANANGSFADLAMGIIRDPAMIRYLDNNRNRVLRPNENLARELMELFTLGEGNYSEDDIKQGARALTGYQYDDDAFTFNQRNHDGGEKTILGKRGKHDGDDFVRILLSQRACAKFIAMKLYDHFVADVDYDRLAEERDTDKVITTLAGELAGNGYELKPTLSKLLKSYHFYDKAIRGNKIKSPVQLVVGTIRMLDTPSRELRTLAESLRMMGQEPFSPPSVAGWDGGRAWINTSTLFIRQNTAAYLIAGKQPFTSGWDRENLSYDPTKLLASLTDRSPAAVVDRLIQTLLVGGVAPGRRKQLIDFLAARDKGVTKDALIATLLLITAMPEYQLT